MAPLAWLIDDTALRAEAPYDAIVTDLEAVTGSLPAVPGLGVTLFEALRAPMKAHPDSLSAQLDYMIAHWAAVLPAALHERLLISRDVVAEATAFRGGGPGPIQTPTFTLGHAGQGYTGDEEHEAFTEDRDWMSNVVLIAKSTHVWLDQLSRRYERPIRTLDQIPDAELDRLAALGFSGLWLIGLWERSKASRTIKRLTGNHEALASAYAVYDYQIAADLGGDDAWRDLRDRAAGRGLRLAGDMVPNHYGLSCRWLAEHPDRFLQLDHAPYPNYRFTGPDLSTDGRITIQLEDGYWNQSDAAVVFRVLDHRDGRARFVYHGNDGTHMPWNDTAQLDYLNPDTREAIIQVILDVARKFPIIRFDAAMTLARRHIRRLWYPAPGHGGAIPSRAGRGMSDVDFEQAIPAEFWREVVDRVQAEAPDTLLLAEAFWMMEGYFVRTLGMHRVYNSAFMNMLKEEQNANYRSMIKDVLEFSPEILKRFVNFMNNPDEETAVHQFGRGDKAFGVTTLMVTLPGLPLFGHGQIEGWTEKYGMEYSRARHREPVDEAMVARHRREIVPLLRKRYLFSEATWFALYDLLTPSGSVDENVFAYSNRAGDERALVLYNNAWERAAGWLRGAAPVNVGTSDAPQLVRRSLTEAMELHTGSGWFTLFTEARSGQQFIRSGAELAASGLYVELNGYQTLIFTDFEQLHDHDGSWAALWSHLGGRPSTNLRRDHHALIWADVLTPWADLARALADRQPWRAPFTAWADALHLSNADQQPWRDALEQAEATLPHVADHLGLTLDALFFDIDRAQGLAALLALLDATDGGAPWNPAEALLDALQPEAAAALRAALAPTEAPGFTALAEANPALLGVHEHEGTAWFNKERMERLFETWAVVALRGALAEVAALKARRPAATNDKARLAADEGAPDHEAPLTAWSDAVAAAQARIAASGYRFAALLSGEPASA